MKFETTLRLTFLSITLAAFGAAAWAWTTDAHTSLVVWIIVIALINISLGTFVTKHVIGQLGTDPDQLAHLVDDIANNKFNMATKDEYTGICQNIIEMAEETKKSSKFATDVLKNLPVPCAIFGHDNILKFTNVKMLELLEHSGTPESYIGQTSGMFMFKDDKFQTATLKTITEKQGRNLQTLYTTMRGNKRNVNGIATPIYNEKGDIVDVISTWIDLTEQTKINERIAQAYENMQQVASELENVANTTTDATLALSEQIKHSQNGAQEQADRVSSTATALDEMKATVLEVARNASHTANGASTVKTEATNGSSSMQDCVRAINDVRTESLQLKDEMGTLSGHAQNINEIMNVISDIADQTNLLALNAAIEAARAGEAGRGFAVVADEVRKLAEKTMTSTTDVGNAIIAIQRSTTDNTRLVEGAVTKIENVTEMVAKVGDALLDIVRLADGTAEQVSSIATAAEEQSSTSEEINRSIIEVNQIAIKNAEIMTNATEAVAGLVEQTQVLSSLVNRLHSTNE